MKYLTALGFLLAPVAALADSATYRSEAFYASSIFAGGLISQVSPDDSVRLQGVSIDFDLNLSGFGDNPYFGDFDGPTPADGGFFLLAPGGTAAAFFTSLPATVSCSGVSCSASGSYSGRLDVAPEQLPLFIGTGTLEFIPTLSFGTFTGFTVSSVSGTITYALDGVPEPATWAMLVVGFGMAGAAVRRRRHALA